VLAASKRVAITGLPCPTCLLAAVRCACVHMLSPLLYMSCHWFMCSLNVQTGTEAGSEDSSCRVFPVTIPNHCVGEPCQQFNGPSQARPCKSSHHQLRAFQLH
jgi:hypothetical protein